MIDNKLTIAIDGPASSGKSTVAKILAKNYNLIYLDTGAMYRCVTLFCLQNNIDVADELLVNEVAKKVAITFEWISDQQHVKLNNEDVTQAIRDNDVTVNVSIVSSYLLVREEMVSRQRAFIKDGGIVMDGRDIGTVVMPNADLKIFMIASANERAKRRYAENVAKGISTTSLEDLEQEILARDLFDSTRTVTPLKKAKDAIELNTTYLSLEEVVEEISKLIDNIKKSNPTFN